MPLYQHEGTEGTDGERRRVVSGSLEDERLAASEKWELVDESSDQAAEQADGSEQNEQGGQVEQSTGTKRRPRGPQTGDEQAAAGDTSTGGESS